MFKIIKKSKISNARLGIIKTSHDNIKTPFFMPDATFGQIRNLSVRDLADLGLKCLVVNALHLFLRPGLKIIGRAGGLNDFTGWSGPVLSDSGGYQVYSLIHKNKAGLSGQISDAGAVFRSPLDGAKIKLTPEQSIKIQFCLGAELMVCFDDCPPNDYDGAKMASAVRRTIKWAKRCRREYDRQIIARGLNKNRRPMLLAVIQGGGDLALRENCARELIKIGFDGFGFGARHIDAAGNFLSQPLETTARQIPADKLRFGLGIGRPEDIVKSVKLGYDMFDCVIPTREGRHGRLFFLTGKTGKIGEKAKNFYNTLNITNARFAKDFSPISPASRLAELRGLSKAYLNYLFKINDPAALRLASLNNLEFYLKILSEIRQLIKISKF